MTDRLDEIERDHAASNPIYTSETFAELIALCREARTVLSAWHRRLGTTQLTHAVARVESAEKRAEAAERRAEDWHKLADLRSAALADSVAREGALRGALCGLMNIDGSPESLDAMRVGIVLAAGTAPDADAPEAAMRCIGALALPNTGAGRVLTAAVALTSSEHASHCDCQIDWECPRNKAVDAVALAVSALDPAVRAQIGGGR